MLTNRELYAIVSRIPLDNEDRGKLYQYLADLGAGGAIDVSEILKLIPAEASETNKLADKAYVNSRISPEAGTYISNDATGAPFASYDDLVRYSGNVKENDFALVKTTDSNGNTMLTPYRATVSMEGVVTWIKKYKDFTFTNNVFTKEQLDAINSGIDTEIINKIVAVIELLDKIIPEDTSEDNKLTNEKYVDDATEEASDSEVNNILND